MAYLTITKGSNSYEQHWTVKSERKQDMIDTIELAVDNFLENPPTANVDAIREIRQLKDAITFGQLTTDNIDEYITVFWPIQAKTDETVVVLTLYDDGDYSYKTNVAFDWLNFEERLITF